MAGRAPGAFLELARALSYEHFRLTTSVVYATQFLNLVAGIFSEGAKVGVSFQPISTADVARVLVGEALVENPAHRAVHTGGPGVLTMRELVQECRFVTGSKARVPTMPMPDSFGTFLRLGKNLIPEHAVGELGFGDWLRARNQSG